MILIAYILFFTTLAKKSATAQNRQQRTCRAADTFQIYTNLADIAEGVSYELIAKP